MADNKTNGRQSLSEWKKKVSALYESETTVSLSFKNARRQSPCLARIKGVYPNFFTVDLLKEKCVERVSFLYSDLLTGTVCIAAITA